MLQVPGGRGGGGTCAGATQVGGETQGQPGLLVCPCRGLLSIEGAFLNWLCRALQVLQQSHGAGVNLEGQTQNGCQHEGSPITIPPPVHPTHDPRRFISTP